ncbi:hypothetical protein A9B99_16440 [Mangrovibacter phragmitis]|uniref:Uncharacterized protein n=1 Tax=Mangrovibacter phragmitis TaxID=1691903 RepID=A0A1B7KYJ6_9ENTR|nr:hypothetical protein A9B99_16440 [Mangrovibacter phragmitis]
MNRYFMFVKQRFNLFYCYFIFRHSLFNGNVIEVETMFRKFEVTEVFAHMGELWRKTLNSTIFSGVSVFSYFQCV